MTILKRRLILGGIACALIAITAAVLSAVWHGYSHGASAADTAQTYLMQVSAPWNVHAFHRLLSPEQEVHWDEQKFAEAFDDFAAEYGPLRSATVRRWDHRIHSTPRGSRIYAEVKLDAIFDRKNALVELRLIQIEGKWRIEVFKVLEY